MSTTNNATTSAAAAQELVKEKERAEPRPPMRDTDFKEKYPPDRELGHELDDTARVWKVYRGEAIDHDDALLKTWNETVNILLTFAGLFSAAVTSFVVASTDDLKPDPNAYVANLLFALGNATAASALAHLPAPPPLEAVPTSLARVVNGLWFTSLFLSLAAALLCILVKQWLDEYTSRTRGSAKHPHEWAQRRSFYFQGLIDWNIATIISFLPLFLHLALFLFLAGLTAFLWDLDSAIRWAMLVLVLVLLVFYIVSLVVPVWSPACPYATLLLAQLRNLGYTTLVLAKESNTEEDTERDSDFAARLDCWALSWLMHDVSDSDAVAVAWQSLGALLEKPELLRFTRMRTTLPGLVEYAGGQRALWRTLRVDGVLDDLQLSRITRSALFISSTPSQLDYILIYRAPRSDEAYYVNTLSPDVALIYAHARRSADHIIQVLHRLHEKNHRPLPSTAMFLLNHLVSDPGDSATQTVGLLRYCDLRAVSETVWTHVASILGQGCTSRETNPLHQCRAHCVVNALCARALQLIKDETSGPSNPRQNSGMPFDAYSHVQLVVRVVSAVTETVEEPADLSAAVWTVLTYTPYSSCRIQRDDRIRAGDWAVALHGLVRLSSNLYASFATQYNLIWSRLLRGFVRNHPTVLPDEGIAFNGGAGSALEPLLFALHYITPIQIEITDPALRQVRLRSALKLVESASLAMYSTVSYQGFLIEVLFRRIPLVAILPTDLALTEEEHNEWVDLFVSAVQHLLVLDPLPWNTLRDAVTASPDHDSNNFFNEVHSRLVDVGPCKKGDCVSEALSNSDWLSALGPTLDPL